MSETSAALIHQSGWGFKDQRSAPFPHYSDTPLLQSSVASRPPRWDAPPRFLVTQPPVLRLKLCRYEKNTYRPFGVVYGTDVLPETSRCRGCSRLQRTWPLLARVFTVTTQISLLLT